LRKADKRAAGAKRAEEELAREKAHQLENQRKANDKREHQFQQALIAREAYNNRSLEEIQEDKVRVATMPSLLTRGERQLVEDLYISLHMNGE
jgi:hypothetical protein